MQTNEVNTIRYLMREMDPSEEIEFEREMMRDENLLIEVESLRLTYKKLGRLPQINAPDHVLGAVMKQAAEASAKKSTMRRLFTRYSVRVSAAALLFAGLTTAYFMNGGSGEMPAQEPVITLEAEITPPVKQEPVAEKPVPEARSAESTKPEKIKPWIDRNEVISFGEQVSSENANRLDIDYTESYHKLILVKQTQDNPASGREILYTKTPVNK